MTRLCPPGLLIALLLFSVSPSHACSCTEPFTVAEALENQDLIFLGTVTNISEYEIEPYGYIMYLVTFEISRHWKGDPGAQVELLTEQSSAACGYFFEAQTEHLVYADMMVSEDKAHTHSCSRTKPASSALAQADIKELDTLTPVRPMSWGRLKMALLD